jgi:hypothetical protein
MEEESEENVVDHLIKFEHPILRGVLNPASQQASEVSFLVIHDGGYCNRRMDLFWMKLKIRM